MGMSDDEIRRALGEGEKPAYTPPPTDGTTALVLLGQIDTDQLRGLYNCAVNTAVLLAEGRCESREARHDIARAIANTARTAALLEVYCLAQRIRAGREEIERKNNGNG